jgi:NAD(P)-dependent dehydrogenase (short-subunit alcohol dehydrogenase family)
MELQDATAVVTGAAAGIGRAVAAVLAGAGAHVVVAGSDEAGRYHARSTGYESQCRAWVSPGLA